MHGIRAISLDLDDTLWPAAPTLVRAEQRTHAWLAANAPPVAARWPIEQLRELRMTRNEALVFKVFDSDESKPSRFTAHSAFDDPQTPPGAPSRESIETRCFAFFD